MAFTVSGTIHGMPVAVTWRSGRLEGIIRDLEIVQFELALLAVFDPEPAVTGRVPQAPRIPPGAIP